MKRIASVTPNYSAKTFTIRCEYVEQGVVVGKIKYRTYRMSKEEFNSESHNTNNDWLQFLRSGEYFEVSYKSFKK